MQCETGAIPDIASNEADNSGFSLDSSEIESRPVTGGFLKLYIYQKFSVFFQCYHWHDSQLPWRRGLHEYQDRCGAGAGIVPSIPWHLIPRILLFITLSSIVVWFWLTGTYQALDLESLHAWFGEVVVWGPLAFIGLYMVWPLAFLPAAIMTLLGGVLFGPVLGTLCSLTGASLGALNAFLISRYLAGNWIHKHYPGRLDLVRQGVMEQGLIFVIVARMLPLFPYSFLNYALGVTPIRVRHFIIGSLIGMSPTIAAYSYLGWAGGELLTQKERWLPLVLSVLALLLVLVWLPAYFWHRRRYQQRQQRNC